MSAETEQNPNNLAGPELEFQHVPLTEIYPLESIHLDTERPLGEAHGETLVCELEFGGHTPHDTLQVYDVRGKKAENGTKAVFDPSIVVDGQQIEVDEDVAFVIVGPPPHGSTDERGFLTLKDGQNLVLGRQASKDRMGFSLAVDQEQAQISYINGELRFADLESTNASDLRGNQVDQPNVDPNYVSEEDKERARQAAEAEAAEAMQRAAEQREREFQEEQARVRERHAKERAEREAAKRAEEAAEQRQQQTAAQLKAENEQYISGLESEKAELVRFALTRTPGMRAQDAEAVMDAITAARSEGAEDRAIFRALSKRFHPDITGNERSFKLLSSIYSPHERRFAMSLAEKKAQEAKRREQQKAAANQPR